MYTIRETHFKEILPIWRDELWPARTSVIEPVSAINDRGAIDLAWLRADARFWKLEWDSQIVGVVSGLFLQTESVRLRGLWLHPQHRGNGWGQKLVAQIEGGGCERHALRLWTMARQSAVRFYERAGLQLGNEVLGFEYGPHRLMHKNLGKTVEQSLNI